MPEFYIRHRTHYIYSGWVIDSANQIKLYPLHDSFQKISEHRLHISANPEVYTMKDYFGNTTGFFSIIAPHQELSVESFLVVEMLAKPLDKKDIASTVWAHVRRAETQEQYHDYLKAEQAVSQLAIQSAIHEVMSKEQHPLDTIIELSDFIYNKFTYKKGVTNIETSVDELWQLGAGVCQDFAHLLLYMLRLMGIPGRYISGYICPGSSEWRGEGATHAWAEAWLPDVGWVGIDPTNKCLAGERHVRLAMGRNFSDCTPVKGTYKGAVEHKLEVTVQFGDKAFTEEQLAQQEPTYVSAGETEKPRNSYMAYMQLQQQQ
jgi:transglutaminase-like putative cysteine protease